MGLGGWAWDWGGWAWDWGVGLGIGGLGLGLGGWAWDWGVGLGIGGLGLETCSLFVGCHLKHTLHDDTNNFIIIDIDEWSYLLWKKGIRFS